MGGLQLIRARKAFSNKDYYLIYHNMMPHTSVQIRMKGVE